MNSIPLKGGNRFPVVAVLVCCSVFATSDLGAQIIYNAAWSGTDISASGTLTISGTPSDWNSGTGGSDFGFPSWLTSLNISLSINGNSPYYASLTDGDFSTFQWQSSTASPSSAADITALRFSTANLGQDVSTLEFQLSFGSGLKEVTATPASGSARTMALTSFSAVPEPEEWAAIASSGLLAFAFWHRRSRKAAKA